MPRLAHRMGVASVALAIALAASLVGTPARSEPPTVAQCSSSYESAQLLRQSGKLIAAREAATSCARAGCPDVVKQDCSAWAGEIQKQIPSVIVIARDAATGDERGARVIVDGTERPEAASGRAFELDPGAHAVRIERSGNLPFEQTVTVVQGERDRVLRFVLRVAPSVDTVVAPTEPPRVSYVPAAIVGGGALVALGASAWLGLSGRSDLSRLRGSCAPSCADDRVDPVRRTLLVSDVLLAVGVVAAGVSIVLFVRPPRSGSASAQVGVTPSRDGARVTFGATF